MDVVSRLIQGAPYGAAIVGLTAFSFALWYAVKIQSEKEGPKVEDVFERACEIAHGSWVVHSFPESFKGRQGFCILFKKSEFPHIKQGLHVPENHPDFPVFSSLQVGDEVALISVRQIENQMSTGDVSTFIRYAEHIRI